MRTTRLTSNLIQLTKLRMMNAYLVREDDGFTLVDTTMSAADDLIAAAVAAGGEIKRIVLTHCHGDHVGSVDSLRAKLGPEVPVMMPKIDAGILAGEPVLPPAKKRGSWPTVKTKPDSTFSAGDVIGSLRVVDCPGHTPGHVAFFDTRDRALIAGDAFSSLGGLAVPSRVHLRFPLPWYATCDRPQALVSARALRALDPTLLVVGHGPALTEPSAAMDQAITVAAG